MTRLRSRSAGAHVLMAHPRTTRFEDTPLGFVAMTALLIGLFGLIVFGLPVLAVAMGVPA